MSFSLTAVISAYDTLGTLVTAVATAEAAVVAVGAPPAIPSIISSTSTWTTYTSSLATYQSNLTSANATLLTAIQAQQTQEAVVTALMIPEEWHTVTGLANWGAASTQYIGIKDTKKSNVAANTNLYTILATTTLPTNPFPFA